MLNRHFFLDYERIFLHWLTLSFDVINLSFCSFTFDDFIDVFVATNVT